MAETIDLELIAGRLPGSRLVEDYLEGTDAAVSLYGHHFSDPEAYRRKAAEIDERFDRDARVRTARAMRAPDGASARLERWVEDGGYLVTTGQQPGLFGGPLYTIYKALSAVRLAQHLEGALGKPVLPLFWVGSEDHDWAEANHACVVDLDNELRCVELTKDDEREPSLHRIPLPENTPTALSSFLGALPETDHSAPYVTLLQEATQPGLTLPGSCEIVLEELLGRFGVFITHAADPVVKDLSRSVLLGELERGAEHEEVLLATGRQLEQRGYELQVSLLEGGLNLFLESDRGRERIYRNGDVLELHGSGTTLSAEDVRHRVEADPTALSPNVLLRPVVESAVFPTLSYVAGPGEIAYFAQIRSYFRAFGIEMPVVHPRASITIVEAKIRKVLDKFGLDPKSLDRPFHELAGDLAREEMPPGVRKALGQLRGTVAKGVRGLEEETRTIDPTLKGPAQRVQAETFAALDDLERKVLQALKRQNEITLSQVQKAQLHLWPQGKPQERVLNAFYYLVRYGGAFLDAVYDRCPPGPR